jgi:proline iminopeptidase
MLEKMNKTSIEYSSYSFSHAMQNGFYYPKEPTTEALNIYSTFKTDSLLIKYSSKMTYEATRGFWQNEKYTMLDLSENLKQIVKNGTPVFGLYGKDDGLFSESQVRNIENLIGEDNLEYLSNCSHNLFIDQQIKFINTLKKWTE